MKPKIAVEKLQEVPGSNPSPGTGKLDQGLDQFLPFEFVHYSSLHSIKTSGTVY
jgi:hypothetical protein